MVEIVNPQDAVNRSLDERARALYAWDKRIEVLTALDEANGLVEQFRRDLGVWEKRYAEMLGQRGTALHEVTAARAELDEDAEEAPCKTCGDPWRSKRHQCAGAGVGEQDTATTGNATGGAK